MSDNFSRRRALTYVSVAVIIGVTAPFTAYAATGGLVNITDPTHATYKAHVNSSGHLLTNDTGSTVSVGNKVAVTGTVSMAPNTSYTTSCVLHPVSTSSTATNCTPSNIPTGRTFVVEAISGQFETAPTQHIQFARVSYSAAGAANRDGVAQAAQMYALQPQLISSDSTSNWYAVTDEPHLYIAGGTAMTFGYVEAAPDSSAGGVVTLTGYLR